MFKEILKPFAVVGIALSLAGCSIREAPAGEHPPTLEREPVPVSLAKVSREKVARTVRGVGRVAASDELRQGFALGGRVLTVAVDEGDHVKRGQLIARLDVREIDAQVRQAEAAASKAERDLVRVTGLHAERVVADEMFQNANTGADVARAARDAAHEARRNAGLYASADGVVLRRLVEAGEVVGAGMPVVVLGAGDSGPVVRVGLADRDAARIRTGDVAAVTLRALPNTTLAGRVRQLAPTADPRTGTIEAEIALDLPNAALVPGVVAAVEITPSRTDEVDLVPVASIVDADGDRAAVYVLDDSGHARRKPVRVAFISGERVAIREGLDATLEIVADGAAYLDEGAPAKVVEPQAQAQVTPVKIAELSVKNPQFTLVIVAMVAALGIHSFASMPRSEDPQFPFPAFGVVAVYPGATPKDVERLVVEPLEDALAELDDIKVMKTKIGDGVAVVQIEFEAGVDSAAKHQEVLRQVESKRKDMPDELHSLEVRQFETTNVALIQVALVAPTTPYHELERLGERLETRLESIDGIKSATVWAYPERQVRVGLDIERLAQHGVGLDQVLGAMTSDTTLIPGGHVDVGGHKLNVETTGRWKSLDDVKSTIVAGGPAGVVRLADVADVDWGYADDAHLARYDGQRAIFVTANQKPGQNVFDVQANIDATLREFKAELPPGVKLEQGFRQATNVAHRLDRLYVDFGLAILLVLVTLLPLGLRASLVVMISIPLSLAIGLALLHAFGYGINQLSIVGFVIALGLLVDDSIVVVENITRFLREGKSRKEAAVLATKQIGAAVLGCTAALIFAFVPLLVLPGSAGDFIRSLPMAVVLTILASLLVSLTVVPFLAASLLKAGHDPHGNLFLKGMTRAIEWTYRPILAFTLRRPAVTLVAGAALFAASVALIPRVGFSLFPTAQTPQFLVSIETPDGSSLAHTDEVVRFVEATLEKHPEIRWTMANIGRGNPQVYYNITGANEAANVGEVLVQIDKYDPRRTPILLDTLRAELSGRADARIKVIEFQNGPQIDAPVAIRLKGDDLTVLTSLSRDVERILETTPGTLAVDNPLRVRRTDLRVEVDRDRAGLFGVATAHVARAVRLGLAGLDAGELRGDDGNEVDVEVTLAGQERARLAALDRLVVPSQAGGQVPLSQVTTLGLESSPTRIDHHDRQRSVSVSAQVQSGFNTDRVTRQVLAKLESLELPPGYRWEAAGEVESRKESFGGLGTAVIVAIFSILAILVLEFRSFRGTVIVASVIPLGIAGGVTLLWLAGETLSFTAAIGFIALIGIEIKNSILLVDFTNQLRAEGLPLDEAIQKAGEIRFVPIVLTSLTAIGGLLPLALQGSALYSPLALVIIGGLVSSTVLSRLITPAVYKLLAPPMALESSHA